MSAGPLHQNINISCGSHSVLYRVNITDIYTRALGVKLTSSAEVKNVWSCTSTLLYGTVRYKIQGLPTVTLSFLNFRFSPCIF